MMPGAEPIRKIIPESVRRPRWAVATGGFPATIGGLYECRWRGGEISDNLVHCLDSFLTAIAQQTVESANSYRFTLPGL